MIIVVIVLISLSIHAWWQTSLFVLVDPTLWHWAQKSSATIEHWCTQDSQPVGAKDFRPDRVPSDRKEARSYFTSKITKYTSPQKFHQLFTMYLTSNNFQPHLKNIKKHQSSQSCPLVSLRFTMAPQGRIVLAPHAPQRILDLYRSLESPRRLGNTPRRRTAHSAQKRRPSSAPAARAQRCWIEWIEPGKISDEKTMGKTFGIRCWLMIS